MKSADGPLGGPVIPLQSPAPWLIIGVLVASSHSGCRQSDGKLGLVAFMTGLGAILMRARMLSQFRQKWLRI